MVILSASPRLLPIPLLVSIIVFVTTSPSVVAQNDFFNTIPLDIDPATSSDKGYSLYGWVTEKIGYGLEDPGAPFSRQGSDLDKVETSLFAQFDTVFDNGVSFRFSGKAYHEAVYALNDDIYYTNDERNAFRNRFEVKDLFVERRFDNGVYLKLGNQLFAWGLAEYSRVTDLINTEDQYTFGQQDLEDLRQQVPAALIGFNAGQWALDLVMTVDAGRNDTAPAGDEFDQLIRLRDSGLTLERDRPDYRYETFVRASTHWSAGDIQLVAGEFNDNALSVRRIAARPGELPQVSFSQNRMRALGIAGNWVRGSWVFFGEVGLHLNKAIQPTAATFLQKSRGWDESDQLLSVLGAEFNGFRNLILSVEVDNTHTRAHNGSMLAPEDQVSAGIRLYWTALNERLQLVAVRNELANNAGSVSRLSAQYNWSDNFNFGLLWMDYHSSRGSPYEDYRNNDVVQLQLQYTFQL